MMPKLNIEVQTTLTPAQVIEAMTDFTDRRTELFPGLAPKYYEVYSLEDTTADVMEGTARPKIWAREVYDWSTPGEVSWKLVESNLFKSGTVMTLRPEATGTGATVHLQWHREPKGIKGRLLVTLLTMSGGRVMKRYFNATFADLEKAMSRA
jgi:hypothetical protein